jgi:phage/plasmid primase-like uncharacterized protein
VKAAEAATAIGAQAVLPTFPHDGAGTDWNDLAQTEGRPRAAALLRQAMAIADREQTSQGLAAAHDETPLDQHRSLSRSLGQATGRVSKARSQDRDRAHMQELGQER